MLSFNGRTKGLIILVALGVLLAIGCTPGHPQSTLDPQGPVAQSQATLFYIIFWAGLFVFIAVEGAILYAAVRYRRRRQDEPDPEQIHGNTKLEIAWTLAPAIVLVIVAVPTIITVFDNANSPMPPEEGGLLIEATGHQWWFEFNYPESGVVTANEVHIPTNEPVNFRLLSEDVIHSFWVPKLAGKKDMIPNNPNSIWLEAKEPGVYYAQCAEFCGISHANMRFRVVAHPREEYEQWINEQSMPAFEPVDPLAQQGQEIFLSTDALCFSCHAIDGVQRAQGQLGPNLTHVASRRILAGGVLENVGPNGEVNPAILQNNLREWLEHPGELKPGNIMAERATVYTDPESALTDQEIQALVAYLMTLK